MRSVARWALMRCLRLRSASLWLRTVAPFPGVEHSPSVAIDLHSWSRSIGSGSVVWKRRALLAAATMGGRGGLRGRRRETPGVGGVCFDSCAVDSRSGRTDADTRPAALSRRPLPCRWIVDGVSVRARSTTAVLAAGAGGHGRDMAYAWIAARWQPLRLEISSCRFQLLLPF